MLARTLTMPSVAEITYFEASEDYKSGLASLDGPLAQIGKATGLKQYVSSHQHTDLIITLNNLLVPTQDLTLDTKPKTPPSFSG